MIDLHLLRNNDSLHYSSRDHILSGRGLDQDSYFIVAPSLRLREIISPDLRPDLRAEQVNRLLSADRKCSRLRWIRSGHTVSGEIEKQYIIILFTHFKNVELCWISYTIRNLKNRNRRGRSSWRFCCINVFLEKSIYNNLLPKKHTLHKIIAINYCFIYTRNRLLINDPWRWSGHSLGFG